MDCSEEAQCVAEEPTAQLELKKGMSIFIDVSKTIFKPSPRLHLHNNVLTWGQEEVTEMYIFRLYVILLNGGL